MNNDDGLEQVKLRNDFYRDSYQKVLVTLLLAIIVVVGLLGVLVYMVTHPPKPVYFATSINGRIQPLVPLDRPNQSKSALLQWANQAAIAAYTYNFVDYRSELQNASEFFTPDGWNAFLQALNASNNLKAVIAKKLVVSAVATGAPIILNEGLQPDGRYSWRVQMPMLITYQSASEVTTQAVIVTLQIVRVSTLDSPRGIGIAQFVAKPIGDIGS